MDYGEDGINQLEMIKNEINFLRELKICENIVQLERSYVGYDQDNHRKTICMVMVFAKHGTILKYLQKKQRFNEEEIRTIMA